LDLRRAREEAEGKENEFIKKLPHFSIFPQFRGSKIKVSTLFFFCWISLLDENINLFEIRAK